MTARAVLLTGVLFAAGHTATADAPKPAAAGKATDDADAVRDLVAARQKYQNALVALYDKYASTGDKERAKWVEDEIKGFHLTPKPAYRIDLVDVFPDGMEPRDNDKKANDLFRLAMDYKGRTAFGSDYLLNQRRAEIVLHDILRQYPKSDKLADVAYELGDLYEGKAYRQYGRAAAFYERAVGWRKGGSTDARMRAARLYDKQLNERSKAIELYREVVAHDTDPERMKEAERRLGELTGGRR